MGKFNFAEILILNLIVIYRSKTFKHVFKTGFISCGHLYLLFAVSLFMHFNRTSSLRDRSFYSKYFSNRKLIDLKVTASSKKTYQ